MFTTNLSFFALLCKVRGSMMVYEEEEEEEDEGAEAVRCVSRGLRFEGLMGSKVAECMMVFKIVSEELKRQVGID
jgi:hypothetical protein